MELLPDMRHGESWLFYTPPPEDVQDRVNGRSEKGCTSTAADEPATGTECIEEQRTDFLSGPPQELLARSYFNQNTCAYPGNKPRAHSIQLQNEEQAAAKPTDRMAPYDASLTSTADGAKADTKTSALARPHAKSLETYGSHPTTSKPNTAQSASRPCSSRGANHSTILLSQLAGYSSSDEDEKIHSSKSSQRPKVPQSEYSASHQKKTHPSGKVDGLSPARGLHYEPSAKADTRPEQRRSAMMASKTGSISKRQAASPIPAMDNKRPRRGPFIEESADDASDGGSDSSEEDDNSSSQRSGDVDQYPKMSQSVPAKGRVLVPCGPPPAATAKRIDVRGMRSLLYNIKKKTKPQDIAPDSPAHLASNTQVTPTTSDVILPRQTKSQFQGRQQPPSSAPSSAIIARQQEKQPSSRNGPIQHPRLRAPLRASATASGATFSRPSKSIPSAALRSTSTVSRVLEPSCQPTIKAHTNGTDTAKPMDAHSTDRINRFDRVPTGGAPKSARRQGETNVVSNILGDIRQNGQRGNSAVRQIASNPFDLHKSPSQKTSVYKELHSPRSIADHSASHRLHNEVYVGPRSQRPNTPARALGVTPGGKDLASSVASHNSSTYKSAASPNAPQLPTQRNASPAHKRKIDEISNDPENTKPPSKRGAVPFAPDLSTARSEAHHLSARQKSIKVSTRHSNSNPKSTASHNTLGNTSEATKPTVVPLASSSFRPSQQTSVSAPSARRSAPVIEVMAQPDFTQQLKPRNPSEVSKAVAESSSAAKDNIPSSRVNSVATEPLVSQGETCRLLVATKPTLLENDDRVEKSSSNTRAEDHSDASGGVKIYSPETQNPSDIAPVKEATAPYSAVSPSPVVDKERHVISGSIGPEKPLPGVATIKALEGKSGEFEEGIALAAGAEKFPAPQESNMASASERQANSQQPVEPGAIDLGSPTPESASSKVSHARASADPQHPNQRRRSVVSGSSRAAEPEFMLGPKPVANLLPNKQQEIQGKERAATPKILEILSIPTRENVSEPAVDSAIDLPTATALPRDVEPFFEYSVLQKVTTSADEAFSDDGLVLSSSCTNIEEANAQAKRVFDNMQVQYQQHFAIHFSETTMKRDDDGCDQLVGTFAPVGHPTKQSFLKVWVHRNIVSQYACQTPKDVKFTSFIAKTVYVVRLFKLCPIAPDSDGRNTQAGFMRVHHPHLRAECYTTLTGANRAAKNLQIEVSHKSKPTGSDKIWQDNELAKLNRKMMDLEAAIDGEDKYWKSEFNGGGLGSNKYELVVEKVALCGPRNL